MAKSKQPAQKEIKCDDQTVTFVLMGATGDLAKRKLIPALYHLVENKNIKKLGLILCARSPKTAKQIINSAKTYIKNPKQTILNKLEKASIYHQMDFTNTGDYYKLNQAITAHEYTNKLCGNRIFYLATLPHNFSAITKNLSKHKIQNSSKNNWSRIVYEKPFGENYKSAKSINKALHKCFTEDEVYRVDHYLEKELVSNLALLRFTNRILEPLWNYKHVESIQIIINEKVDVQKRGTFYDSYGAIKDVVQNHALQLLALSCMEAPKKLDGDHIRSAKAQFLKTLSFKDMLLGQYDKYTKAKGVAPNSKTETFAAIRLQSSAKRWYKVPIFIKTGKALKDKQTLINIKFKQVECKLDSCPTDTNHLTINIDPTDNIQIHLYSKVPGSHNQVIPMKLELQNELHQGINTPQSYELLIQDVIKGDKSVFVRSDEIEYAWKLIDKIKAVQKKYKLHKYKAKSTGPEEMKNWNRRHNITWKA